MASTYDADVFRGFTGAGIREHLEANRPFPLWKYAVHFLSRLPPETVPIAVIGSANYEYDLNETMKPAATQVGRMFSMNPHVTLLTGGMPTVGQDAAEGFFKTKGSEGQLYNLLPRFHDGVYPQHGRIVEAGHSYKDRQLILGMSAKICVLIGGGPGATREANVALQSGGVVLPIACCGGAAAGLFYDLVDPLEQRVDFELAQQRYWEYTTREANRWDVLIHPSGSANDLALAHRGARIISTYVTDLCPPFKVIE